MTSLQYKRADPIAVAPRYYSRRNGDYHQARRLRPPIRVSVDPHLSRPAAIRRQKSLSPKRRSLPLTIPHAGCRPSAKDSRTKSITAKTCRRAIATGLAALERPTVRVVAWHSGKVTVAWPEGSRTYEKACRRDPAGLNLGAIAGGGWGSLRHTNVLALIWFQFLPQLREICRYRLETAGPLLGTQ